MQNFIAVLNKRKLELSERILIPILPADAWLALPRYQKIISDIAQLVAIADEQFNILYKQLITNFVQFVQLIPLHDETYLSGMIDQGLLRALTAIQLQKREHVAGSNGNDSDIDNDSDPLMDYMFFSATLLFDIGFVAYDRTIIISQEDGTFIKEWLPHKGAMQPGDSGYYRIRRGGNRSVRLSRNLTAIFARQLMPAVGFNWIAQDHNAFNIWLSLLLNHKEEESNKLKLYFNRVNKKTSAELELLPTLLPQDLRLLEPQATALGEEFLDWLENNLQNKNIKVNGYDSDMHVIENGLFIEMPAVVENFCAQSPANPSIAQVLQQLEKIGFMNLNEMTAYTYKNRINSTLFLQCSEQHQNQPINDHNHNLLKKIAKHEVRTGIELFAPYFLAIRHRLKLGAEKHFTLAALKKENRKKAYIIKRKKQRRLKILLQESEEALQVQLKLNLGMK